MDARIVGWDHTSFGAQADRSFEDLILTAGQAVLDHAGLASADVDALWIGQFNNRLVPYAFPSCLALGLDPAMRRSSAMRVDNACVSGSTAVYTARDAIRAGRIRTALGIGVEKMTGRDTERVTEARTGVSMHIQVARRVTGIAEDGQLPGAELEAVFNMGGSGVANYCSILEAVA